MIRERIVSNKGKLKMKVRSAKWSHFRVRRKGLKVPIGRVGEKEMFDKK